MNDVNVTEALLKAILELIETKRSKNSAKASSASWMSK